METLKLKKVHYTDLAKLLTDCGVVKGKVADPSRVLMSPEDLTLMRKALTATYKKKYSYLGKRRLDSAVAMEMLNLSPSECKGVRKGYVIINK